MSIHTEVVKRVLDFLDEYGNAYPVVARVHGEDGIVDLTVSDLYILCDAAQQAPLPNKYALSINRPGSGLMEGENLHTITTESAWGILTGAIKLGIGETLMEDSGDGWKRVKE